MVAKIAPLLALFVVSQGHAAEHEEIVERAFMLLDNDYQSIWAFTETRTNDDGTHIASYDPRKPDGERWILLSVDDGPPTEKDIKSFRAEKQKQAEEKSREPKGHSNAVNIKPGTLKLIEETDELWLFGFVPADENDDDKFMRYVNGTLKIAKDGEYVESIVMKNDAPIKPAFGVKITNFHVRLDFGPAAPDGPIVPQSIDAEVEGRAYLTVGFHDTEAIRFSNYARVVD